MKRIALVLFAAGLVGLSGCGHDCRVYVPAHSNVETPVRVTVVQVTPQVANHPNLYPEYVKIKKPGDPEATVTCLAIEYTDTNRQYGKGPYLMRLEENQVKKLKAGARLLLVMDGKNKTHTVDYTIE